MTTLSQNSKNIAAPRVVILHDWLTGFRGGERVLEAICELFPEAPIYTLLHVKGSTSPLIESREIVTSFLNRVPGARDNYRKFLPLMPLAAERLRITHPADIVISSSHCVIKGVPKPQGSKHLSYVHSPMRYIYDQFENYFGHTRLPVRLAANLCRPYLQFWDRESNRNVDQMIGNSDFVARRIEAFYHRDAKVIHPFVDLSDFRRVQSDPPPKENFFLMVTAFAPNKKVDLALQAFRQLKGLQLKIVGSGSREETLRLKALGGENVQFLGNVSRDRIVDLMARALGFVFPGVEDFGITPLESLAAGTPVIAYRAGGVLETLTPKTAVFFNEADVSSLVRALESYQPGGFDRADLLGRAEQFSKQHFQAQFLAAVGAL